METTEQKIKYSTELEKYKKFYSSQKPYIPNTREESEKAMNRMADCEGYVAAVYKLTSYDSFLPQMTYADSCEAFWGISPIRLMYDDQSINEETAEATGWSLELNISAFHTLARTSPYLELLKPLFDGVKLRWVPSPSFPMITNTQVIDYVATAPYAIVVRDCIFIVKARMQESYNPGILDSTLHEGKIVSAWSNIIQ